jgi:hypothetical protein
MPLKTIANQFRFGPIVLSMAVALVGACRAHGTSGTAGWAPWFDSAFQQLPRAVSPPVAPHDWVDVRGPDGLRARLEHGYKKRNDYGCWATGQERWPGPGWRDVCIHTLESGSLPGFSLKPGPLDRNMADQHQFADWRAEALALGNRRALVERGRATGGLEGAKRERRMRVVIELRPGQWASLYGRTGDDDGYEELIRIAGTIEPPLP